MLSPVDLPLANLTLWVTPLWLFSLGTTIAGVLLLLLFGLLWVVARPAAERAWASVQESVLLPISYVMIAFACLCLLAIPTVETDSLWPSLTRLSAVGTETVSATVPAGSEDFELAVSLNADEIQSYTVTSDQDLRVTTEPGKAYAAPLFVAEGGEAYRWTPSSKPPRGFQGNIEKILLTNESDAPATMEMTYTTDVEMPEVHDLPWIVGAVMGIYLVYLGIQWLLPGISNIAVATAKEAIAQPLFLLFLVSGAALLILYIYLPYNTFGEDVKMLKDSGLSTIMVLAIIFALWTASVSIADEIEGKTALTLLSKPISRRQFILGKFLGIIWPVMVLFVVLGAILMATVSYKVVYDARETSNPTPEWEQCYSEMISVVPGLVLSFLETVVLAAISVAISTRLPMLPNLIICGTIYVLGHLTPLLVQSSIGNNEYVAFIGKLIALVVPMLDYLNTQSAIAGGRNVPAAYLLWATMYTALYSAIAMLFALILFEDRDLA